MSSRWWSLVSVGVHRAIAQSLLREAGVDLQNGSEMMGPTSLADVLQDA